MPLTADSSSPSAAVLAMLSPWLAQFDAGAGLTCAELIVTLPDGQTRTLKAAILARPAPVPAPVPVPAPRPAPVPAPTGTDAGTVPAELGDKERALLRAAGTAPIPRKKLILRAGLRYNSHSREVVKALVTAGLLVADGRGVRAAT